MAPEKKERIKSFCLYHFPDIPPANKRCKGCLENYDISKRPNNYDCPDFFAYPPIRYEDVKKILDKGRIKLNPELERKIIKRIEILNSSIILKHLAGKDGNIKIDYEEVANQILMMLKENRINNLKNYLEN